MFFMFFSDRYGSVTVYSPYTLEIANFVLFVYIVRFSSCNTLNILFCIQSVVKCKYNLQQVVNL
jgi:hypothetical protein